MTTIAILPERTEDSGTTYRAVAGHRESVGKTAGEALDALTSQLSGDESSALVIVQQFRPDRFFRASQQDRLAALMARWRAARDNHDVLPPAEQSELESLVEAELQGATQRAEQALRELDS